MFMTGFEVKKVERIKEWGGGKGHTFLKEQKRLENRSSIMRKTDSLYCWGWTLFKQNLRQLFSIFKAV